MKFIIESINKNIVFKFFINIDVVFFTSYKNSSYISIINI